MLNPLHFPARELLFDCQLFKKGGKIQNVNKYLLSHYD